MIRTAGPGDLDELASLRSELWPDGSPEEHRAELVSHFSGGGALPSAVFVAAPPRGPLVGFCEVSIRPHAEGCVTDRVGYLEGWYVSSASRGTGIGRELVRAAEEWARSQGCSELASDAAADNRLSAAAHLALGFVDVGLIRCFRKNLDPRAR